MNKAIIRCKCGEQIDITGQLDADLRLIVDDLTTENTAMKRALESITMTTGCECDSYHAHKCVLCVVRGIARKALEGQP
jgi:hypothetical protein